MSTGQGKFPNCIGVAMCFKVISSTTGHCLLAVELKLEKIIIILDETKF
jgi:hypothetical protein